MLPRRVLDRSLRPPQFLVQALRRVEVQPGLVQVRVVPDFVTRAGDRRRAGRGSRPPPRPADDEPGDRLVALLEESQDARNDEIEK